MFNSPLAPFTHLSLFAFAFAAHTIGLYPGDRGPAPWPASTRLLFLFAFGQPSLFFKEQITSFPYALVCKLCTE